ncbi:helix-turn-helix transcriptional regulator [Rhodococcus sp. NPDC054953]
MDETWDYDALARAIRDARLATGMTQVDLAAAAGVSRSSLAALETGRRPLGRLPVSLKSVTRALGWPSDRAMQILQGEEDIEGHQADAPESAGLPLKVSRALADGELVDTGVIDMMAYDADRQSWMVFAVKRAPGSPGVDEDIDLARHLTEAIREAAAEWAEKKQEAR